MNPIWDAISGLVKPITDLIGKAVPDADKKLELQATLSQLQFNVAEKMLDYESQLLDAQSKVVIAEAQGNSFLQRNWRPMTMLAFVVLIILRMFDLTTHQIPDSEYALLWELVKYGLTGYVAGRSIEKTAPAIAAAITASKANK